MTEKYELSRRKTLAGLATIGAAGAGAGLGTSAYFSDEESFTNNSLTAGELDLFVEFEYSADQGSASGNLSDPTNGVVQGDAIDEGATTEIGYTLGDVKPGDSGEAVYCPRVVDNDAWVWVNVTGLTDYENGLTEPEANDEDEDTSEGNAGSLDEAQSGEGEGDLSDAIQVTVNYCEPDGDGGYDTIRPMKNPSDDYTLADLAEESGFLIDGNEDEEESDDGETPYPSSEDSDTQEGPCICIEWEIPTDVGNEIQSDSLEYDVTFYAEQSRHNEDPENPYCTELSLDLEEQYNQLQDTTLPDPYVLEIEVEDENGDPFTGEITSSDHGNDQFVFVTDHLGEFDETPENRYGDYVELDFDENGTAQILLGNDEDADVGYLGLDVNDVTENIEVNVGDVIEGLKVTSMCVLTGVN